MTPAALALVLALQLPLANAASAGAVPKRGFSGFLGEEYTCDDAKVLGLNGSWWYNWGHKPDQHSKCNDKAQLAAEFVPMIIGLNVNLPDGYADAWRFRGAKYLLGFNEPDYGNGHNHPHMMHPAAAAAEWPKLQKIAASFDPPLQLVSPAVSSTGLNAQGQSKWLDEFFGNCTSQVAACEPDSIKFVAFHDYNGDVDKLTARINGAAAYYKRKIWLTEFAITKWGAPPPRNTQDAYLKSVLPALDANPNLFRYVWFTARNAPNQQNGGSNLLPCDSTSLKPTSTGEVYHL